METAGGSVVCYEHLLIYFGALRLTEYLSLVVALWAANHGDKFVFELGSYPSRNSGKDERFT
jgi:hypothetical protein